MLLLTARDHANLNKCQTFLDNHPGSGGTYDMTAMWSKGKWIEVGNNELFRPANTIMADYPDICGVHAELDLCFSMTEGNYDNMRGGTVYVLGKKASSGNLMSTTKPCIYCAAVLRLTRVRYLVYFDQGRMVKVKVA